MMFEISSLATKLPPLLFMSKTIALTFGFELASFNSFSIFVFVVCMLVLFVSPYVIVPLMEITAISFVSTAKLLKGKIRATNNKIAIIIKAPMPILTQFLLSSLILSPFYCLSLTVTLKL